MWRKYTLNLHKQTKIPPHTHTSSLPTSFPHLPQKELIDPSAELERKRTCEKELRRSISAADVTQIFHLLMARVLHWRRSAYIRRKRRRIKKKTSECAAQTLSGRRWEEEKGTTQQKLIAWFQTSDSFTPPYIFIVLILLLFMPMFTPVLCLHVQSVCYRTAASLISFKSSAIQSPGYFSYFPSKREILPLLIGFRLSEGLAFQVRPSGKVVGVTGKAAVRSDAKCK